MSTLLSLLVKLGLDSSEYDKGIEGASGKATGFSNTLANIGKGIATAGIAAAGAAIAGTTAFLVDATKAAMEAENIQAQLAAVLKSTGGAAGVTADQVNQLADKFSKVTKFEDDAIISGQNMLLTFTGIGKDVFPDVTQAMLDMSQAMGQDLKSTALQLGKALNNPADGLSALTRVGVRFTEEQERMVKSMVAAGDIAGAQKIILKELATEFGGSAEAAGNTASGKIEIFKNTLGNLKETIGGALLPVLSSLADRLTAFLGSPEIQNGIAVIVAGFEKFAGFLTMLADVKSIEGFGFALQMAFGPEAGAVFLQFKDYLQQALDFFGGLWSNMLAIVDQFIPQITANVTGFLTQLQAFWAQHGELILSILTMAWNLIVTVIGGALTLITGLITSVMAVLNGDWSAAWEAIKNTLLTILESALSLAGTNLTDFVATWRANWEMLVLIVTTVINNILAYLASVWNTFREVGFNLFMGLKSGIAAAVQWVIDAVVNGIKQAIAAAKLLLHEKSPSKVFAGIGENMMLGLAKGINDTAMEPVVEVRGVTQASIDAGQDEARNVTNNWYYQGNATPQQVYQSYEMARAMG
jgi:phage-related protein